MTWKEFAQHILSMSEDQQAKDVVYLEPYDDEAEVYYLDLHYARADIADPEGEVKIHKGDFFLQ